MGCGLLRGLHKAYLMSYLEISYGRETGDYLKGYLGLTHNAREAYIGLCKWVSKIRDIKNQISNLYDGSVCRLYCDQNKHLCD